jgi:hypothetical protein
MLAQAETVLVEDLVAQVVVLLIKDLRDLHLQLVKVIMAEMAELAVHMHLAAVEVVQVRLGKVVMVIAPLFNLEMVEMV